MIQQLVSVAWLANNHQRDDVRVADVRWYLGAPAQGRREHEDGHIPGAIFLDLENDLSARTGPGRHPLPEPEHLAARLGQLGIGSRHHVIAYDSSGGSSAARLWWLLRHLGHHQVSVLDGGFPHWRDSGYQVAKDVVNHPPEVLDVTLRADDTIDRTALHAGLGELTVIDARAAARYRGESEPVDPAAGHIPTALNAPHTDNLGPDGCFRSPEELAERFHALGIDPDERAVSSCGSGVTACHNILAMHLAGFAEPLLYPGSWSDWATEGLPVALGDEPGDAASIVRST